MRRQFNNLVSVIHSALRFGILRVLHGKNFVAGVVQRFSPNVVFEVNSGARVKLGNRIRAHSGCKFKIRKNAELVIEDGVKMNYNCILVCRKKIYIGAGTEFGPSVFLYDHNHDYKVGLSKNKFNEEPIIIGRNCWIGANTVILSGATIGDNCVIGAGSVVKGCIPDKHLFVQKRQTYIYKFDD